MIGKWTPILVGILAGGGMVSCKPKPPPESRRPVLAEVNGEPIYVDEYRRHLKRLKIDEAEGIPTQARAKTQSKALLDDLINRRLLLREAEPHKVVVGIDEVEAAFQSLRYGWPDDRFERLLADQDITASELKRELRETLMIRKYFRDHVYSRVVVTDEEIEHFLGQHQEKTITPERVRALQIVVKHEAEAREIARQIKRGLSFEDAAMKYSLSPEGKNGGDLGLFPRGAMPQVVDETCFSLRAGEMSNVVRGNYGFHLFKVVERQSATQRPLAEVHEEIEKTLRQKKEFAAQNAKIEALRRAADIQIREDRLAWIQ